MYIIEIIYWIFLFYFPFFYGLGCGNALVDARNALKSCVNIQGQQIIDELNEGVLQLRDFIEIGDIQGQSNNLGNLGAPGSRNLVATTSNPCLQQAFLSFAELESFVAYILQYISDPNEAADIVCNALNYQAPRLNSCSASTAYSVFV